MEERRLAKLHRRLDFLDCDCYRAYYTQLTWWRTRRRWRRHRNQRWWKRAAEALGVDVDEHAEKEKAKAPPRFRWHELPNRLRQEAAEGGCLHSLRTQLELVEEAPWLPFPRNVVQHIEQYLGSAEMDSMFVLQVDNIVRWANALCFLVKPLLEAEAAKMRRERDNYT